jgi:hypothetical protein
VFSPITTLSCSYDIERKPVSRLALPLAGMVDGRATLTGNAFRPAANSCFPSAQFLLLPFTTSKCVRSDDDPWKLSLNLNPRLACVNIDLHHPVPLLAVILLLDGGNNTV